MRQELEQKLIKDFPDLFIGKDLDIKQNLMCFGCECDDGWFQIIYDFCKKANGSGHIFTQIKEKYGYLCLYMDSYTDEMLEAYDEATELSLKTCELCGDKADLCHKGIWLKTLCQKCMIENDYELMDV